MLDTPLNVIESFGAPTNSYLAAVNYFRYDRYNQASCPVLSQEEMEEGIAKILGTNEIPHFENNKETEIYFLYVIQETVRAFLGNNIPDMSDVWNSVQLKAQYLIKNNPWVIKDFSEYPDWKDRYKESNLDSQGEPKKKKGTKKDEAIKIYKKMNNENYTRHDILAAFVNDVKMTMSGAATYFHNFKYEFGFNGSNNPKKRGRKKKEITNEILVPKKKRIVGQPTKTIISKQIYERMLDQPKQDVIAEIIKHTGTTPQGANTYYCLIRRELNSK